MLHSGNSTIGRALPSAKDGHSLWRTVTVHPVSQTDKICLYSTCLIAMNGVGYIWQSGILCFGSKTFLPETCVLTSSREGNLLTDRIFWLKKYWLLRRRFQILVCDSFRQPENRYLYNLRESIAPTETPPKTITFIQVMLGMISSLQP